ncbi:DUF3738 domain-containing protein [Dokdonia sinensis]|uniref:DUF3738 domain-containing protein n=1 Tax=Dokdonia sinensis TaxID=2479847 RepID=A0A3M0G6R3_9FLAO|nr:redoxin domain-containing protein [Dokdonia sinensis]RMB60574.1 DUF3738 domain-containing protein [Dokdonia sinensis]
MEKTILSCLAILILWSCKQETAMLNTEEATIGAQVPNLKFNQLLNDEKEKLSLYDIEADVVILDFWATWCGPCLSSFPKMSKLQETYGNQLKIIAVTDESKERIATFLENRPQSFTIAIDIDGSINSYFKHRVIPHYVILDKDKIVRAITSGDAITQENIERLLSGQEMEFEVKKEDVDFDPSISLVTNTSQPIFQSTLLPYNPSAPGMSNDGRNGNRLFAYNLTMPSLFKMAYGYRWTRVKENFKDPDIYSYDNKEQLYCYEMIFPNRLRESRLELMQKELANLSNITAKVETQLTDVYLLQKIPNTSITLPISTQKPDPNGITRYGEGVTLQGEPITTLVNYYEEVLGLPVMDNTGYNDVYDITVKWYIENTKKGMDELKKYGLEVIKAKRNIDFLVLSD